MKKILFAWLGHADLHASRGDIDGFGPIANALRERSFDELVLLSAQTKAREGAWLKWAAELDLPDHPLPTLHVDRVALADPTDFAAIHAAAVASIDAARERHAGARLTFHLSPGTPAMAAIWLLLARTRYGADLIQSSPEAGVEDVVVPFDLSAEFLPDVVSAPDRRLLQLAVEGLPPAPEQLDDIVHRSPQMRQLVALARRVAARSIPVLVQGETGTGKELLARLLHHASPRAEGPFRVVNCAAIPSELIEAELFGHEKGAFTGADRARAGYFEEASGGTLFLDEVGDLPRVAQAKLLRALQEGEVTRVGARQPVAVDVRTVAATNRDLLTEVAAGRFREDLFHRLAVGLLVVPPLRDRQGDVGLLIDTFLERIGAEAAGQPGTVPTRLTPAARNLLLLQPWPGNIRELENTLLRASIWGTGERIGIDDVRAALLPHPSASNDALLGRPLGDGLDIQELIADLARHYLERALTETDGNKTRAAELVGLPSYQTFTNWMKRYGVG